MLDAEPFVWQPNQPFNVVLFRVARELENDHIPAFGITEYVGGLADQDSVTVERGVVGIVGEVEIVQVVAIGTDSANNRVALSLTAPLEARADPKLMPALAARDILVGAHQGRSHRARRDHKGFGDKGAK